MSEINRKSEINCNNKPLEGRLQYKTLILIGMILCFVYYVIKLIVSAVTMESIAFGIILLMLLTVFVTYTIKHWETL